MVQTLVLSCLLMQNRPEANEVIFLVCWANQFFKVHVGLWLLLTLLCNMQVLCSRGSSCSWIPSHAWDCLSWPEARECPCEGRRAHYAFRFWPLSAVHCQPNTGQVLFFWHWTLTKEPSLLCPTYLHWTLLYSAILCGPNNLFFPSPIFK